MCLHTPTCAGHFPVLSQVSIHSPLSIFRQEVSVCGMHLPEEGRENCSFKYDSDSEAKANAWKGWNQTWWDLTGRWVFSAFLFLSSWGLGERKQCESDHSTRVGSHFIPWSWENPLDTSSFSYQWLPNWPGVDSAFGYFENGRARWKLERVWLEGAQANP